MAFSSKESYQQPNPSTLEEMHLFAGVPMELDPSAPIDEADDHTVLARIKAGEHEFLVLDLDKSRIEGGYHPFGEDIIYSKRFLLVDQSFNPADLLSKGFKGVDQNETIIGRLRFGSRFRYDKDPLLSRQHFSIKEEAGKVIVTDLESLNGTRLTKTDDSSKRYYERMREKEDAARQSAQQRHQEPDIPRKRLHQDPAERQKQIGELHTSVRGTVKEFETNYPDLDIASIAEVVSAVHESRLQDLSDKKIYMDFAKKYHPDRLSNLPDAERTQAETVFKLIGDMYDPTAKSFRF